MTSRIYASLLAAWLVVCSVVATRHEAQVAHAVDSAGRVVHAQVLVGHHDGPSDVHEQSTADHDECTIVTALHQAARVSAPAAAVVAPHGVHAPQPGPALAAEAVAALYRLAPKTSPPDRAT